MPDGRTPSVSPQFIKYRCHVAISQPFVALSTAVLNLQADTVQQHCDCQLCVLTDTDTDTVAFLLTLLSCSVAVQFTTDPFLTQFCSDGVQKDLRVLRCLL
jgi:hypothetical protein